MILVYNYTTTKIDKFKKSFTIYDLNCDEELLKGRVKFQKAGHFCPDQYETAQNTNILPREGQFRAGKVKFPQEGVNFAQGRSNSRRKGSISRREGQIPAGRGQFYAGKVKFPQGGGGPFAVGSSRSGKEQLAVGSMQKLVASNQKLVSGNL